MQSFKSLLLLLCVIFLNGCLEKSDPGLDQQNFNSIFDNNQFAVENYPIDIKQTADGGYLILGERRLPESNFRGIYLLKADKFGKFVSEVEVEDIYVNPVGDFLQSGDKFYFFCMEELSLSAQIIEVDETLENIVVSPAGGLTYPAATSMDGSDILLLSYNHEDKEMIFSRHNTSGNVVGSAAAFSIGVGDDIEEPIINHFIRTGKRFPFQVGRIPGGLYYFNGFLNYTFSLVFTNLSSISGVVQGQQDDGGISAAYPLGGNKFAAARFNFGDNYFLPNINLETTSISSSVNLLGNTFPELTSNAPVKIKNLTINNENVLLFASDTKSKQIGMYFYNEETGEFRSSSYVGFSNPYEIANITTTEDGGIAICGTTYLAGRFPRIFISKFSKDKLAEKAQ
jgi:hypothetical protein